jgi:hypothetical protein
MTSIERSRNKKTPIIIVAILTISLTPYLCFAYSGGSGTTSDPYQIANVADWQQLMAASSDLDKAFLLTADIDLAGITVTPIAPDTSPACYYQGPAFTGVFDGNNHIVRNITINLSSSNYVGVFACVGSGGIIKNLNLDNAQVTGSSYVGCLIGYNGGNIYSCRTSASGLVGGYAYIGSLAGYNYGIISDCNASGSVSGYYGLGGIVGYNYSGTVNRCYASCSVTASSQVVGGLVAKNEGTASVSNSHASGNVYGKGLVGGLVGLHSSGCSITSCYATGDALGTEETGGLVGWNDGGVITDSNASGDANGTHWVGGLAGYNGNNGSISFCFSTGNADGLNCIGGFLGNNIAGTVHSCYSTGAVTGDDSVGGFTGGNSTGYTIVIAQVPSQEIILSAVSSVLTVRVVLSIVIQPVKSKPTPKTTLVVFAAISMLPRLRTPLIFGINKPLE